MEEPSVIEENDFSTLYSFSNVPTLEGSSSDYDSPHQDAQGCSGDENGNSVDQTNENGSVFNPAVYAEQGAKKRRKQSNPVRYHTTQVLETQDSEELASKIPEEALNLEIKHKNSTKESEVNKESLLKCQHCNSMFQNEESLRVHIEEEHVQKLLEKQLQQQSHNRSTSLNGIEASSTEAQRDLNLVGANQVSSFTTFNEQKFPLMPISCASSSSLDNRYYTKNSVFPSMPPLIPISHSGDGKPTNMSLPLTMFPTGDGRPTNMSLPLTMFPNSFAPFLFPVLPHIQGQNQTVPDSPNSAIRIFNPEAYCELCNKEFCNKYFLKTHKANKHGIYSSETMVTPSFPGAFLSSTSANPVSLPPPLLKNPPTRSSTPHQAVMNLEVFCEICQKEFPNKYFLKNHKHKVHGIAESLQNSVNDYKTGTSPATSTSSSPGLTLSSEKNNNTSPPNVSSETSIQNFPTLFNIQKNSLFNPNAPSKSCSATETIMSSSTNVSTTVDNKASIVPTEDSSSSEKGSAIFTPEKLREIGVINADAFCELCCKEFCNKYFLRTHKLNKHGISISESGSKFSQSGEQTTSSPTLEAGELPSSSNIPITLFQETHSRQENIIVCGERSGELTCEICNRPFASQYLLKMHKFYTHNIPYIKEEDEKSKSSSPVCHQQSPNTCNACNYTTSVVLQQKATISTSLTEESSGQDLQRLQTMIRELNAPLTINENKVACSVCNLQFDSKYYLRAHMMNEHGLLLNEDGKNALPFSAQKAVTNSLPFQQSLFHQQLLPPPFTVQDSEAFCELCQKTFSNSYFLKLHKQNIHNLPADDINRTSPRTPSDQASLKSPQLVSTSKPISSPNINNKPKTRTGSNFCNICNKELCNKYFMKTHMLKMHGIDLNEQPKEAAKISTIGGVTCDVCQKELCSKYFLKVHKQNTHGIYVEPPPNKECLSQPSVQQAVISNQNLLPGELVDSQYFSHYTEICPLCDRRFKSIKWLKSHIISDHNAARKDIESSPENVVINDMPAMCVICDQSFDDQVALQVHLIKDHHTSTEELGITNNSGIKITQDSSSEMTQDQLDNPMNGSTSPRTTSVSLDHMEGKGEGTKLYHCSYCTYTSCWLSNLYAHEKRHTTMIIEGEKRFFCRICQKAYRYNHSLQRHLLSHRTSGFSAKDLTHPLKKAPHLVMQTNGEQSQKENGQTENEQSQLNQRKKVKRYRCSKCDKKFRTRELCLEHIHDFHNNKKSILNQQKMIKFIRCPACGFIARAWSMLKLHINKQHNDSPEILKRAEMQNSFISETSILANRQIVSETSTESGLKGFSFQPGLPPVDFGVPGQLPMSYAMPQSPRRAGTFIMQPFFLSQPEKEENIQNDNFVPSLVYLPVCQKIAQPTTVAFSLTPA